MSRRETRRDVEAQKRRCRLRSVDPPSSHVAVIYIWRYRFPVIFACIKPEEKSDSHQLTANSRGSGQKPLPERATLLIQFRYKYASRLGIVALGRSTSRYRFHNPIKLRHRVDYSSTGRGRKTLGVLKVAIKVTYSASFPFPPRSAIIRPIRIVFPIVGRAIIDREKEKRAVSRIVIFHSASLKRR